MHRAVLAIAFVIGAAAVGQAFVHHPQLVQRLSDNWNPLPDNYQTLAASAKLNLLWQQVKYTEYDTLPAWAGQGFVDFLKKLKVFFNLAPSLDYVSDVMPEDRPKAIHTYGVVGQIEFVPVANSLGYTGLFASGAQGVARISLAADPTSGSPGYVPGIAVKFLRDGIPSVNIVANDNLDGQGSDANIFKNNLRTWLPAPTSLAQRTLFFIFGLTEPNPAVLPVRGLALADNKGNSVDSAVFPNMLVLMPDDRLKTLIPSTSPQDIREILTDNLPTGPLYHVYKADSLTDPSPVHIADLNIIGDTLRASEFGDEKIFFQHQRKNPSN